MTPAKFTPQASHLRLPPMQSRELVMGAATAAVALTLQRFFASRSLVLQ